MADQEYQSRYRIQRFPKALTGNIRLFNNTMPSTGVPKRQHPHSREAEKPKSSINSYASPKVAVIGVMEISYSGTRTEETPKFLHCPEKILTAKRGNDVQTPIS